MERCIILLCFLCLVIVPNASCFKFDSDVNSWDDEVEVKVMPTLDQFDNKLDTKEDAKVFWNIDSQVLGGFIHYADSALDVDTSILNLTNPNEFNAEAFGDSTGIWYFAHHVMFENSDDPWVTYATFNFTPGFTRDPKYLNIRYYLHGDTVLQVYGKDAVSENITKTSENQEWEEIFINLDELELDPENNHTEEEFRLEFHTAVKSQDFFLLDKICVYSDDLPYTGPTTTTVKETTITDTSATTPRWTETPPTTITNTKPTTDESDDGDAPSTTTTFSSSTMGANPVSIWKLQSLFLLVLYHILN